MAASGCVSLVDVLHEVPRLWDFLQTNCLQTMLSINAPLRKIAHQYVTHLAFPSGWHLADIDAAVSRSWLQLQVLDLRGSNINAAAAAQISTASWPLLRSLSLDASVYLGSLSTSEVFHHFCGKWPLLESLTVASGFLDLGEVVALTRIEWPLMKSLCVDIASGCIPAFLNGNRPQLTRWSTKKNAGR